MQWPRPSKGMPTPTARSQHRRTEQGADHAQQWEIQVQGMTRSSPSAPGAAITCLAADWKHPPDRGSRRCCNQ